MNNNRIHDGSSRPPRLELQQSWWAMNGIGTGGKEWSIEEKFERLARAGFTGILGRIPEPKNVQRWHELLQTYQFSFGAHMFPFPRCPKDATTFLQQAKAFGAQYVNCQIMDEYVIGEEAVALLRAIVNEGEKAGIPLFIETHRGRITQDVMRTCNYVQAIPDMQLSIDLSHYVVAGAMEEISPATEAYFDQLLRRTGTIHARISNGHQVQIDVGLNGSHAMMEHFLRWWRNGMKYWLNGAHKGDYLPFVCELGSGSYAISNYNKVTCMEEEISDRWQQSLLLKDQAERIWRDLTLAIP